MGGVGVYMVVSGCICGGYGYVGMCMGYVGMCRGVYEVYMDI